MSLFIVYVYVYIYIFVYICPMLSSIYPYVCICTLCGCFALHASMFASVSMPVSVSLFYIYICIYIGLYTYKCEHMNRYESANQEVRAYVGRCGAACYFVVACNGTAEAARQTSNLPAPRFRHSSGQPSTRTPRCGATTRPVLCLVGDTVPEATRIIFCVGF